jgi:hypothetical protein
MILQRRLSETIALIPHAPTKIYLKEYLITENWQNCGDGPAR